MRTISGTSRIPNASESLSHLQVELSAWRSTGSFGKRIPEELSKAAAELARVEDQGVLDGGDKLNSSTSSHSWSGNRRFTIQLGYSQAGLLESETYVSGKGRASCLGEATRDRMMEDVEA